MRDASDPRYEPLEQQPKNGAGWHRVLCGRWASSWKTVQAVQPLSEVNPARPKRSFYSVLVCPSPARHSWPTQMPNPKIQGLRWRTIGLLMPGSIINHPTRSTPAADSTAKQRHPAVAWTELSF